MLVRINGNETEIADGSSVEELIRVRRLPYTIVIELNGDIIKAGQWGSTKLNSGDKLEMIQLVVGG